MSDLSTSKDERDAERTKETLAREEFERVAREFPQFAESYAKAVAQINANERELERLRDAREKSADDSTAARFDMALRAVGYLLLVLPLVFVVVLPLATNVVYFYMDQLSFVGKECALLVFRSVVLIGVYLGYRFTTRRRSRR